MDRKFSNLKWDDDDNADAPPSTRQAVLYRESHRRRRISEDVGSYRSSDVFLSRNIRRKKPKRLSDVLLRSIRVPLFLFLVLVFWGPTIVGNPGTVSGKHRQPPLFGSFSSSKDDRDLGPSREDEEGQESSGGDEESDFDELIDQQDRSSRHGNRKSPSRSAKSDQETRSAYGRGHSRDMDPAVLEALRAVKSGFRLPPRTQQEDDEKVIGTSPLSEDEREGLSGWNHNTKPRKDGNLKPQFREFHLEKEDRQREFLNKQKQKIQQQQEELGRERELQRQQEELQRQREELLKQRWELQEEERLRLEQETRRHEQEQKKKKRDLEQQKQQQQQGNQISQNRKGSQREQTVAKHKYAQNSNPGAVPGIFVNRFADVWSPIEKSDTAMFWHIPKSGGTTVANIATHCFDLVTASNIGVTEGHGQEQKLAVRTYHDKGRYVNVNTASVPGINHARDLGLARSGLADIVILHRLHEGAILFDPNHKARVFCMFRHPVERAVSMFYYLQRAKWEPTYDPSLASMTLLDYANSEKVEENWVTRYMLHEYSGRLTKAHVETAKQIMRTKFVVGIMESYEESMRRFESLFRWERKSKTFNCQNRIAREYTERKKHPDPPVGDPGYQKLEHLNWADMRLYDYARLLFQEQQQLISPT